MENKKIKNMTNAVPKFTNLSFADACTKCVLSDGEYVLQGENSFGGNIFAYYDKDYNSFIIETQKKTKSDDIVLVPVIDFTNKSEGPLHWNVTVSTATDTYSVYSVSDLNKINI